MNLECTNLTWVQRQSRTQVMEWCPSRNELHSKIVAIQRWCLDPWALLWSPIVALQSAKISPNFNCTFDLVGTYTCTWWCTSLEAWWCTPQPVYETIFPKIKKKKWCGSRKCWTDTLKFGRTVVCWLRIRSLPTKCHCNQQTIFFFFLFQLKFHNSNCKSV